MVLQSYYDIVFAVVKVAGVVIEMGVGVRVDAGCG